MSLLFYDGFDNYTYLPLKWDEYTKNCQFSIKDFVGRKGSRALCATRDYTDPSYDYLGKTLPSPEETLLVGFAFKKVVNDYGYIELGFSYENITQSKIQLSNYDIVWYKADGSSSYGVKYALQLNVWNYIEIKLKSNTVSGSLELRINEHTALFQEDFSTATVNFIDELYFKTRSSAQFYDDYAYIDDFYIANVSGTINNNFLGNCSISSYVPQAQGNYSDFFLPSTVSGIANYLMINSQVYPENTTKIYTSTFLEYESLDDGGFYGNTLYTNTTTTANFLVRTPSRRGVFFRFSKVTIPKGAKIITAKLQLYVNFRFTSIIHTFTASFQKSGTPVSTITSIADFDARTMTDSRTTFYISDFDPVDINHKDSLQELVSRDDWLEEDNIVLLKMYTSDWSSTTNLNSMYDARLFDYSNDPYNTNSPKLYVEWVMPNEPVDYNYLYTNDINIKESYSISVSNLSNILALKCNIVGKRLLDRANTDDLYLYPVVYDNLTTYIGTKLYFKDTAFTSLYNIFDANPSTGTSWVLSELQNLEFGFLTTISG